MAGTQGRAGGQGSGEAEAKREAAATAGFQRTWVPSALRPYRPIYTPKCPFSGAAVQREANPFPLLYAFFHYKRMCFYGKWVVLVSLSEN